MIMALGFFLGFLGYLPLGNINMTVVQLSLEESTKLIWGYILFVALMELVYCSACLLGINFLLHEPQYITALKWFAVVIFTALGLFTIFKNTGDNINGFSNLKLGIFIAIVNPLQIPFWLVWGVYIADNKFLTLEPYSVLLFGFFAALGNIVILWVYATNGKRLVEKLNINRQHLNRFMGLLFLTLAAWELGKILTGK